MEKEMNTKFVVGDEVTIVSNGNHGTVKSIASYLGEGRNIYLVRVDNVDKMCVESNLEIYRKKNTVFNLDLNEAGINFMIEDRINEIIEMLGLKRTKEDKDQLLNAAKLQAYLTISDDYENEKNSIGNNILKYNLYNGLVNGVDEPIINSCMFTQVLRKVGMDVKNVVLKLQDNAFYVANLVLIGKDYYFFDLRLLDYSLSRGQSIIYPRIIWGICHIIYFYILRQYRKTDRGFLFVAARIFFKIQSVCRHFFLRLRGGLWDFIELKGVSGGWHQIAPIYEFMELVMVCRASHTNGLSNCHGGQSNSIIVCVGCEI